MKQTVFSRRAARSASLAAALMVAGVFTLQADTLTDNLSAATAGTETASGDKALAQTSASAVVVTPEETEGPYWVDEQFLARGDERHIEAGRKVHHSFSV